MPSSAAQVNPIWGFLCVISHRMFDAFAGGAHAADALGSFFRFTYRLIFCILEFDIIEGDYYAKETL